MLNRFSQNQLTELAAAIAWENHRGRLNQALGVHPSGFADDMFCALPERPRPFDGVSTGQAVHSDAAYRGNAARLWWVRLAGALACAQGDERLGDPCATAAFARSDTPDPNLFNNLGFGGTATF